MSSQTTGINEIKTLRAAGYKITHAKRQRLRDDFAPRSLDDLRFILNVERCFYLFRDRDGLALELAFLNYHTIPWPRVHVSARKRVERVLNSVNREFHRASGQLGDTFHPKRIPKVAKLFANRVIPKRKIIENSRLLPLRGLLTRIFAISLNAAYFGQQISETDVLHVILDSGLPEPLAQPLAHQVATLLEDVPSLIRLTEGNVLLSATAENPDTPDIAAMLRTSRSLEQLFIRLDIPAKRDLESLQAYPETDLQRIAYPSLLFVTQNLAYCLAFAMGKNESARERLNRFASGNEPELELSIANFNLAKEAIGKFVEVKYGKIK